jgi:type IV pilus assembly protein PilV
MSCISIKALKIMKNRNSNLANKRGFTLLEALISFMILSIGMLGIASLQAISLKAGKTSVYGSVAMMKADELIESIRANASALSSYTGAGINNSCTGAAVCSDVQLAQDDVYWWKQHLKAGLPEAVTTSVTVTAATPPSKMATVKIDLGWKERNKDATGSVDKTYSTIAYVCTEIPC